jgi:ATP-dependent helicase HrpB
MTTDLPNKKKLQLLPIDPWIPKILESLERCSLLVLQASPGSGKTTRVPPALLRRRQKPASNAPSEILVLEPRRVAAKYAARRVAEELGSQVGQEVGYQFRFENATSAQTKLRFLTEGMLMRRLLSDPKLARTGTVIIDEFHERHLHGDIALAYLKRLQREERPDLEIIVMSATLDTQAISSFLNQCPVISVEAPRFPVETDYLKTAPSKHLEWTVKEAVQRAVDEESGDILVFLPGMADIRRSADALADLASRKSILITPLHGELSREEQTLAIEKQNRRKIILSTNLAETSLTIEGVTVVIDSGLHRQASYSHWSGVPSLKTRPISRASAIQRAGRAGRTAPGKCYRLYTKGDFDGRAPFDTPEVQRADLAQTILELKSLGVGKLSKFDWFESPSPQALSSSETLLQLLGALQENSDRTSSLTSIGKKMTEIPAHPRLARMLIEAEQNGASLSDATLLAALISEGELGFASSLDAMDALKSSTLSHSVKKVAQLYSGNFSKRSGTPDSNKLRYAVLTGFPDRVSKKRPSPGLQTESELLFSSGGSAKVPNSNVISESEFFVTLEIQERQNMGQARAQVHVKSLITIEPEWLFDLPAGLLLETEEITWDPQRKRVAAKSQMKYGELVLSESPMETLGANTAAVLLKATAGVDLNIPATLETRLQSLAPFTDAAELESAWARLQICIQLKGGEALTPNDLDSFIVHACEGKVSFAELQELDWSSELLGFFAERAGSNIAALAPTHFELPNKRRPQINYKIGSNPWIESRLQDFFGVKVPPSIANGRVPLTLHLLAPNQRALQVTTDLPGFWARTYPEVRKELSRRYPRHPWPENPLIAELDIRPTRPPRR